MSDIIQKVRESLNKFPLKKWEHAPEKKLWTTDQIKCANNSAKYHFLNCYTVGDAYSCLLNVKSIGYGTSQFLEHDLKPKDIMTSSMIPMKVKWGNRAYCKHIFRNNDTHAAELKFYLYESVDYNDTGATTEILMQRAVDEYYQTGGSSPYNDETALANKGYFLDYPSQWEKLMDTKWVRTEKVVSVYMPPGSTYTHTVHPGKKTLNYQELELSHTNTAYAPGQSRTLVVRVNGTLAHDANTLTNIGFCPITIDHCVIEVQDVMYQIDMDNIEQNKHTIPTNLSAVEEMAAPVQVHANVEVEL